MKSASGLGNEAKPHSEQLSCNQDLNKPSSCHLLLLGAALVSLASLCLQDIMLKSLNTGQTAKVTAKQHRTIDLLVARKKERGDPKSFRPWKFSMK